MEQLIDSHFHLLEMKKRGLKAHDILEDLFAAGFFGGIDIGVAEDDLDERTAILDRFPQIKLAAGIGPWGAQGDEPIETIVSRFTSYIAGKRVDCIGEIGLDHYWKYGTTERQIALFKGQVHLAEQLHLPIIVHTREADADMAQVLDEVPLSYGGIMHCFSSGRQLAEQALKRGMYISFAGPITYKKNVGLREMLAEVPLERLLLETDSPYLSPEPWRGTVNTPFRMVEIYAMAAQVRQMDVQDLAKAITRNFERLFAQNGMS